MKQGRPPGRPKLPPGQRKRALSVTLSHENRMFLQIMGSGNISQAIENLLEETKMNKIETGAPFPVYRTKTVNADQAVAWFAVAHKIPVTGFAKGSGGTAPEMPEIPHLVPCQGRGHTRYLSPEINGDGGWARLHEGRHLPEFCTVTLAVKNTAGGYGWMLVASPFGLYQPHFVAVDDDVADDTLNSIIGAFKAWDAPVMNQTGHGGCEGWTHAG